MSTPAAAVCPSCHAAIAPGSAFCTRCGAATAPVTEIAPVLAAGQQWGGSRRRDRRGAATEPGAVRTVGPTGLDQGTGYGAPVGPAFTGTLAAPAPSAFVLPHHPALGPAFDGVAPAGVGRRLGAYAVDLCAVLVAAGAVLVVAGPVYAALAGLEVAVGLVVWEARSGRTLGNAVLGLRTAKEEAPFAPGLGRAVGRALVLGASHLTGLGQWLVVASASFDRSGRGQAWHDRAAGTLVVDIRSLRSAVADAVVSGPVLSGSPVPQVEQPAPAHPTAAHPPAAYPTATNPAAAPPPAAYAPAAAAPPAPPGPPPAPPVLPAPRVAAPAPPAVAPAPPAPPVPPAARPAVPTPAAPPAPPGALPAVPPAAPPAPAAASAAPSARPASAASRYLLKLDNGQAFTVHGSGLVGRRPQTPPGETYDHLLEIEDPGRSLSRTHARFGVDAQGFWVEDRGSANGTAVQTDAGWMACVPGRRTRVTPGSAIRLGDRTLVVEALG